jgi:hypothetical protein
MRASIVAVGLAALAVTACTTPLSRSLSQPSHFVGQAITAFNTAYGEPAATGEDGQGLQLARYDFVVRTLTHDGPQLPTIRYSAREEVGYSPTGERRLAGGVPISPPTRRPCSILVRYDADGIIQSIEASSHRCARIRQA